MNGNEVITILRQHSDDGGFDSADLQSSELTERENNLLAGRFMACGHMRQTGGYRILSKRAQTELGDRFTVAQAYEFADRMSTENEAYEKRERAGLVTCACGHRVPKTEVMWHNTRGALCSECYGRSDG